MNPETFFDNFGLLADTPNGVQKLRELILQLAVQGKLVPQDSDDEPAVAVLEMNEDEIKRLIKGKKIKKSKPMQPIDIDKFAYKIPNGWAVEYLGNITPVITKGSTPTSYGYKYQNEGINFVKVENVKGGRIVQEGIKQFISEEVHLFQARSQLEAGDILFSIAGTIGETCVVKEDDLPANTNQALAIIRNTKIVFWPPLLKLQLDSFVANAVKARARGGAMNNVSLGDLKELIVFVPPLEEQRRIVAKVDQLMALCDELEAKIRQSQTDGAKLMDAVMHQLVAT